MTTSVRLDVFSDYQCPWCYNAAVRIRDIQHAYGDRVHVHWRTFPLIVGEQPDRRVTQKTRDGWQRIGADEPRAYFAPPEIDVPLPASSIPALTAAKSAERQGNDAFERFHDRLFTALFRDHLDIGRPEAVGGDPEKALDGEVGAAAEVERADRLRPGCIGAPVAAGRRDPEDRRGGI